MTVTATAGILGWGLQASGAKDGAVTTWNRHKAADIDLAALDDVRTGPPEIGGDPVLTMAYKAGAMAAGGATIYPRLEDVFGQVLLCLMGSCTTDTDEDIDAALVTGLNHHTFKFATSPSFVPYLSFRKKIPHDTAASELGEEYKNAKILSATFGFPNDGPISARIDAAALEFSFLENPEGTWTWGAAYEDYPSIPIGCVSGGVVNLTSSVGGALDIDLPVVGASVTMANVPLDFRQEKIYGDPWLQNITPVQRGMSFDLLVQWDDPDIYQRLITASASGTTWSPTPFTGKVIIESLTPTYIDPGTIDKPYRMRITGTEVLLQQQGGVRLGANQSVLMRLSGPAIAPASGDYATIEIQNEVASYVLP